MIKKTTLIGIDPSNSCTGVAVFTFDAEGVRTVESFSVKSGSTTTSTGTHRKRRLIRAICTNIQTAIDRNPGYKVRIAIEDYAYGAKFSSEDLAELGGALKQMFLRKKWSTLTLAITTVKKCVSGVGNMKKEFMPSVLTKLGYDFALTSLDVTDAIAVAHTAQKFMEHQMGIPMKAKELESCKAIKFKDTQLERHWNKHKSVTPKPTKKKQDTKFTFAKEKD